MNNIIPAAIKNRMKIRDITIQGLLIALVFIATRLISIRLPVSINGGLIHAGNIMLFSIAFIFGNRKAAIAGAFGMGLFDIVSGWLVWAPFTFIVRGIMGYLAGSISHNQGRNGNQLFWNIIAIMISGLWMITGYYATEGILYGNWSVPLTSIPGNVMQLVVGVMALVIAPAVRKVRPNGA